MRVAGPGAGPVGWMLAGYARRDAGRATRAATPGPPLRPLRFGT